MEIFLTLGQIPLIQLFFFFQHMASLAYLLIIMNHPKVSVSSFLTHKILKLLNWEIACRSLKKKPT